MQSVRQQDEMRLLQVLGRIFGIPSQAVTTSQQVVVDPRQQSTAVHAVQVRPGQPFNLTQWVEAQKANYGKREGLGAEIDRRARQLERSPLGISGPLLDELVTREPRLVPKVFWGGPRGWLSAKRESRWRHMLGESAVGIPPTAGLLIRFYLDASEWVPHPYAPPHWTLTDFKLFSTYIVADERAFRLCAQWASENSVTLNTRLASRLERFDVRLASRYQCYDGTDYAEVALAFAEDTTPPLTVTAPWKGQAALAQLVTRLYPDTILEYSPAWLKGQRLDVFIPSLEVAIEFQGEQHYRAVEIFGGAEALRNTRIRDKRKAAACREAGVALVEWRYSEAISEDVLSRKLLCAKRRDRTNTTD